MDWTKIIGDGMMCLGEGVGNLAPVILQWVMTRRWSRSVCLCSSISYAATITCPHRPVSRGEATVKSTVVHCAQPKKLTNFPMIIR